MRLSRRQLRRIMLEAVRGPDRSDSFILDPELPDDETHPVLSRRSQASYDAQLTLCSVMNRERGSTQDLAGRTLRGIVILISCNL